MYTLPGLLLPKWDRNSHSSTAYLVEPVLAEGRKELMNPIPVP